MDSLKLIKDSLWRLLRSASVTLTAMGMLFAATNAAAACGDPLGLKPGVAIKLPFLEQPGCSEQAHPTNAPDNNSIVGLWYVNYTSGGELVYESFDTWHSDGTELENPNLAPATGPYALEYGNRLDRGVSGSITLGGISTSTGIPSEASPSTKPTPSVVKA